MVDQQDSAPFDQQEDLPTLRKRIEALEAKVADYERTRSQLREEHSFRKAIIDRAAEGVCVCHGIPEYPNVRFTVWNDRMTDLTGYTMEEINRLGWYQTVYPDPEVQARAQERMQRMREGDDLLYERWEITRADGEKRTLGISTSLLTSDDGVAHVVALMSDVTDEESRRQRLTRRINELEQLLPICASCKNIRDDKGQWHRVELYLEEHLDTLLTHGLCPQCVAELLSGNET